MSRRQDLYPEIRRLREDEGLKWREIGERLGISLKTAFDYYDDPTGEKTEVRKARNDGVCAGCGGPTKSSGAKVAPEHCSKCFVEANRLWTREAVIAAIQRWADEHGGVPPTATQWQVRGDSYHPPTSAVQAIMGSWAEAIRVAGFDAFARGCYGREGEDPAVIAEAVELYRSGLSLEQVGQAQGVTGHAIAYRLKKASEPRRSSAEGIRLRMAA